jgi:MYXO-CTERM domain-containing protein
MADGLSPQGVKAKLQLDLNRDGKLDSFETLSATVAPDGSYALRYELEPGDVDLEFVAFVGGLIADYQARGFEALLDDGPLPVLLSFEREGYSTVVKRLSTLFESPNLDVTLAPLNDVQCSNATCLSPDGALRMSQFPPGTKIARGYADAYDPSLETARFPGLFTDESNNLLISSGFAEVNFYQEDGKPVHQISAPVSVRFEAQRASWNTMPDLDTNTGRIELPMYSFDQVSGEWVTEADGELQDADGRAVSEDELSAIRDGSYEGRVFVAFDTQHFSTFNCDAPISIRGCVKGRIVAKGTAEAVVGVAVSVDGISYTGSAGTMITGLDGTFATDVRKSELEDEDLDNNGKRGEMLEARVIATGTGVFVGEAFVTPRAEASVGVASRPSCKPAECECLDLGDIEVEFEEPRLCEVTLEVTASGDTVAGEDGPLLEGQAVVGAQVRGALVGGLQMPQAAVAALCADTTCNAAAVAESGLVSFAIPVVGDAPQLKLDASLRLTADDGGTLHYYTGSLTIDGCARDQSALDATASLTLDHASLSGFGEFIASLGDLPKPDRGSTGPLDPSDPTGPGGCACRAVGGHAGTAQSGWLALILAGLALTRRRRQAPQK